MTEAAREARKAYKKAWNRANPDKVKQHQERYWEKKVAQAQAAEGTPQEKTEGAAQ